MSQSSSLATLAICNLKGGSGKTTSAVCLSEVLARAGARVLFIDLDPGGTASAWLDERDSAAAHLLIGDFDTGSHVKRVFEAHRASSALPNAPTETDGAIDLVAADRLLNRAMDIDLQRLTDRLTRFLDAAAKYYDAAILDTPPQSGPLMSAALRATASAIVPVAAGRGSTDGLKQVLSLAEDNAATVHAAFACNVDVRADLDVNFARGLVREFGLLGLGSSNGRACRHYVRSGVAVREAEAEGALLGDYAPDASSWADYQAIAYELTQGGAVDLPKLSRYLVQPDDVARLDLYTNGRS